MMPDCRGADGPAAQSEAVRPWVMGVILSVASGLIMTTNLLVAAALLKLLLRRRSQSWCLVLNLALADALVGVAITGLATEDFSSDRNLLGQVGAPTNGTPPAQGKTRCLVRMAFVMSPCTASIMSMFLISLDRYAAIKMPLWYAQRSGKGTAVGFLLALWISSIIMGFLPVMARPLQTDGYDGFCTFFSVIHVGIVALFSACFFPVLCVFVCIYLDILRIACSHQRKICQTRQAGSWTSERPGPQQHQQLRAFNWSHVKALRTVAVLVGCFLALWCPFFLVCIVQLLCRSCRLIGVLENYLWLLGLSNSLINPLVYAFWQKEVRLQLAAMFSCATGWLTAAGPPGVNERNNPQNVAPQASVAGGDILNPSLLRPVIVEDEAGSAPPCSTTSL